MSPRDLAFCALLLITLVRFSTTSIIRPQELLIVRLSPKPVKTLKDIPDRWKMHPEFTAPQIEIQLLKSHVSSDENWMLINKYKYSGKGYHGAAKVTSTKDQKKIPRIENGDTESTKKEKESEDNIVMPDNQIIPQIGSRNIFTVPSQCPVGQREDSKGRCRTIIT